MPAIVREIMLGRTLIDQVYSLDEKLPPREGTWSPTPEVVVFAQERARAATRFTAALYLTAWQNSARVQLPPWLEREPSSK